MRKKPATLAQLTRQVEDWNSRCPIGSVVEYHPIIDEPAHRIRKTRTLAQVLSGHTAVVWLDGESGCVCLEACVLVIARPHNDNDPAPKSADMREWEESR